jgi:hypothetical protein
VKPLTKSEIEMTELQDDSEPLVQDTSTPRQLNVNSRVHRERDRELIIPLFCQYEATQISHLQFENEQN